MCTDICPWTLSISWNSQLHSKKTAYFSKQIPTDTSLHEHCCSKYIHGLQVLLTLKFEKWITENNFSATVVIHVFCLVTMLVKIFSFFVELHGLYSYFRRKRQSVICFYLAGENVKARYRNKACRCCCCCFSFSN